MIFLLIIYFVLLLAFIFFSASVIYHLFRFGYVGDLTRPVAILYTVISLIIIIISLILILTRNWPVGFDL